MKHVTSLTAILFLALGLAACGESDPGLAAPAARIPAQPANRPVPVTSAYTLDESRLPGVLQFAATDLGETGQACTDFNSYVNGKWLAANEIPGDRTSWGAFGVLNERSIHIQHQLAEQAAANSNASGVDKIIADLWATGMDADTINQQGLDPIRGRLERIAALDDSGAIAAYLRESAASGETFVFAFDVFEGFEDASINFAYAMQGGLGLPDRNYYFDEDKQDKLAAYQVHVAKVLELSGVPAEEAAARAEQVIAFETRLAGVSKSNEDFSRDVSLYYNPVSPAEADARTPNFPWTAFFEAQGVTPPPKFSLAVPAFHEEVSRMLAEVPPADWQAYLRFHTVDGASPFLSDAFVQQHFEFYGKTLYGQQELKERWKRVLGTIEDQVGEAMGQLYVRVAFPPAAKARMVELVGHLSDALKGRIENLAWMTDETRAKALEKWKTFTPKIGYPDKWRSWEGLQTSRDSYIGNVLAANKFNYEWALSKIGEPVDPTEWGMPPQMVNAYYNPLRNEIVFPAAILQPPFFDFEADDPLNYGGIGAVIGHEMTHGYDDQGSRFGPTGEFENWWSEQDASNFKALTDKLVAQFNNYQAAPGLNVNGNLTLGENIADLGGLATAYDAMKAATAGTPDPMIDGLSRDQRFFLGWATAWRTKRTAESLNVLVNSNPHAPETFRAIGAPSNLPAFAVAFSCTEGQPMARAEAERTAIW